MKHTQEAKDKIREAVKKRLSETRQDGMLGVREPCTPSPAVDTCSRCGRNDRGVSAHHVDEDYNNFLPSNLEPLCVPCHSCFHSSLQKLPYLTIGKQFTFAAAHFLPDYNGPCKNLHGHEWRLEVVIKKRIDPKTGMVMDFRALKETVKQYVIDKLDHTCLNDTLTLPTAENILVWVWEELMLKGWLKGMYQISLWETSDSIASISVEDMLRITREKFSSEWEWEKKS